MKKFIEQPQNIFLIIAIFWGFLFMIFNPPFQAPDEDSHLYKIYGITDGSWSFKKYTTDNIGGISLGKKLTFSGQILPSGLVKASRYNKRIAGEPLKKTSFEETAQIAKISLEKENKIFIGYPAPFYTPLSYIPAIFFVLILKLINASPFWMLYVSRLCSLITYTALLYFTIKITPVKKWMFLTLGLLPMCLYQASALSTDGLSNGAAFFLTAYALYLSFSKEVKKITRRHILTFLGLITLLSICKFTYFWLILLYFLIPKERFDSKLQKYKLFALIFGISGTLCIIPILYHMHITQGLQAVQSFSTNLEKSDLTKFIFNHPIEYILLISKTLLYNFRYYLNGFVGLFGWIDTPLPYYAVWTYIYTIVLASITNYDEKSVDINLKEKILFSTISLGCLFLICTSCYLNFLPDDYTNTIAGIQGRYFIPFAPLFFLLFYNTKINFKTKLFEYLIIFLINFVLFISLIRIIYRFYI